MSYFILEQDFRVPEMAAVGSVPKEIDPTEWIDGKIMPAPSANPLQIPLARSSGSFRSDIIGTLVTLYSDFLRDELIRLGIDNIQYFPVEIIDQNTGETDARYSLANIIGLIQAVDASKSQYAHSVSGPGRLLSFSIDEAAVKGQRIFRLKENPTLTIIDEQLRDDLVSFGIVGALMRQTEEYDGI